MRRKSKLEYAKGYDPKKRRQQYEKNWEQETAYRKQYQKDISNRIFEILGNRCSNPLCRVPGGMDDRRCLQVDHINGGGNKERERRFGNRIMMLKYYVENPEEAKAKLQILCANCNWIKRHENNELPLHIGSPVKKQELIPLTAFIE